MKNHIKNLGKVTFTIDEDTWSADREYDRITMITAPNGNSYISRIDVPKEIDIENVNYWRGIGAGADIGRIIQEFKDEVYERLDTVEVTATDAKDIADSSKATADTSLTIANKFERDLNKVKEDSTLAIDLATSSSVKAATALDKANSSVQLSERGKPNGVPILDELGKIPKSQLPIDQFELVDSYLSDRVDAAPTADALKRLYEYHNLDKEDIYLQLESIKDLVGSTTELGVSPALITIDSLSHVVKLQVTCNGAWSIDSLPEYITATPTSGVNTTTVNLIFSVNSSESEERVGTFIVTNSYGKSKTISYRQYSASVRYVYNLTVVPDFLNFQAIAGDGEFTVVSTKTPYINATPAGEPENVEYSVIKPESDTWFTLDVDNKNKYSYSENILEAIRSTRLTIKQSSIDGKSIMLLATQKESTNNIVYRFEIVPTNAFIVDAGGGNSYSIEIISTKTTTINATSTTENVDYIVNNSGGVDSTWVTYSKVNNNVTLTLNNNESARNGSIEFIQESPVSKRITLPIQQEAANISWKYTFDYSPVEMQFGNSTSNKSISVSKSTKQKLINGSLVGDEISVDWSIKSDQVYPEWFSLNTSTYEISVLENTGVERQETLYLVQILDEAIEQFAGTILIKQQAGVVTWEYNIEASATPTNVDALNGTTTVNLNSTKQKYINGVVIGSLIVVPCTASSANGWLTGSIQQGNSLWTMTENGAESTRNDNIVITQLEDGGKQKTINITQRAGVVTYEYTFNANPTTLNFIYQGGRQNVNITSNRQKFINGKNSGGAIDVGYNAIGDILASPYDGNKVDMYANNTLSARTGIISYDQDESAKVIKVTCNQAAGVESWVYTFNVSPTSMNFGNRGGSQNVIIESFKRQMVNNMFTGHQVNVAFNHSSNSNQFTPTDNKVIAGENRNLYVMNGVVTYTQNESNISKSINVSQVISEHYSLYESSGLGSGFTWAYNQIDERTRTGITVYYNDYINGSIVNSATVDFTYELVGPQANYFVVDKLNSNTVTVKPVEFNMTPSSRSAAIVIFPINVINEVGTIDLIQFQP